MDKLHFTIDFLLDKFTDGGVLALAAILIKHFNIAAEPIYDDRLIGYNVIRIHMGKDRIDMHIRTFPWNHHHCHMVNYIAFKEDLL